MPALPVTALLRASHPGPSVAVTALTFVLSLAVGHGPGRALLVAGAVGAGQLTIGWSNDLIDLSADRQVHRPDKPLARGDVAPRTVRGAIAVAAVACVVLSVLCGPAAAAVHLLLGVGGGWAYNLGLKRTVWSFVPYATAFGSLPAVATLALPRPVLPPAWMVATGALLGVGAHLLNALPDLADDEQTGVRGLPHRLGAQRVRVVAPLLLLGASMVAVLVPPGEVPAWGWAVLLACGLLGVVAVTGRGRVPFAAAIGIAAVDVVTLVVR